MDAQSLVSKLITLLSFSSVDVVVNDLGDSVHVAVTIPQDESGVVIGYHGETIDALQLVVSLMLNRDREDFKPVEVDVNGYRLGRQTSLEDLAAKAAEKAIDSGREIILPPLSPRERRIIHVYLSSRTDVSTYSEGEGTSRRLVVRPATPELDHDSLE